MANTVDHQFNLKNFPSNKEIADNVKAILKTKRLERGLSQRQIGEMCDKDRGTVGGWERTNPEKGPVMKPDYRDLCILCNLYNISLDWLFSRNKVIPSPEVGYVVKPSELYQLDGHPIYIENEDFMGWGLVCAESKEVVLSNKKVLSFDEMENYQCSLIPKDVYRKEAFLSDPLALEDIKHYMKLGQNAQLSEEEKPKIWVSFMIQKNVNTEDMDGWFYVDPDRIYSNTGIVLSVEMYEKIWIAFTDRPKIVMI